MIGLRVAVAVWAGTIAAFVSGAPPTRATVSSHPVRTVSDLVGEVKATARRTEASRGMREAYQSMRKATGLPESPELATEFAVVRVLFEATRDAGLWNLHWAITNRHPTSKSIWREWTERRQVDAITPTATAECDELSALFSFLATAAGVKHVGLFWPTYNHTVAVWCPLGAARVRVVVPTTQIFLEREDMFGTKRFDPWRQESIHTYRATDVSPKFPLSEGLYTFLVGQINTYMTASDMTLQKLRYIREAVFWNLMSPEEAAQAAVGGLGSGRDEDRMARDRFARDMRAMQSKWPLGAGPNPALQRTPFGRR